VNGVRSNSVQNGVAGAPAGLNPYQMQYNMTKNPVMRNMLPNFVRFLISFISKYKIYKYMLINF